MTGSEGLYHYSVVRDLGGPGYADIVLTRAERAIERGDAAQQLQLILASHNHSA
jgi:hypothetical protein